jgi:lipopolysaccharide export LptBFGC system permease protein LptF
MDPVFTDNEIAYRTAIAEGRTWWSRWLRIAGYFALLNVVALHAYDRTTCDWGADDRRTLARMIGISAIAFAVTALLLIVPPAAAHTPEHWVYLIPQALPIAIPIGITWGILCGLGGRAVRFRVKGAILALALAGSAGSLATTLWIMPAGNQAYRVAVFERLRPQGSTATLTPGPAEMPMGELRKTIDALTLSGQTRAARSSAFTYYVRWSLPFTPLALAVFALALVTRPFARGWVLPGAATSTCLAYYVALFTADAATRGTHVPVAAVVWLPNVAFLATAIALFGASLRSRLSSAS